MVLMGNFRCFVLTRLLSARDAVHQKAKAISTGITLNARRNRSTSSLRILSIVIFSFLACQTFSASAYFFRRRPCPQRHFVPSHPPWLHRSHCNTYSVFSRHIAYSPLQRRTFEPHPSNTSPPLHFPSAPHRLFSSTLKSNTRNNKQESGPGSNE